MTVWQVTFPVDSLWYYEEEKVEYSFVATVLEINGSSVLVRPVEGENELRSSDKISFSIKDFENIGAEVGSVVEVTYSGGIMKSYPAQINAKSWKLSDNLRHMAYSEQWLDKTTAEKYVKLTEQELNAPERTGYTVVEWGGTQVK